MKASKQHNSSSHELIQRAFMPVRAVKRTIFFYSLSNEREIYMRKKRENCEMSDDENDISG
jgi:hypothetical protein